MYQGRVFDVYHPTCIVPPQRYSRSAFTRGPDTFVRAIRISDTDIHRVAHTLPDFLDRSSELLKRVAGVCGATVIEHEWCLTPGVTEANAGKGFLPDGFNMAAKVRTARDATPLDRIQESMLTYLLEECVDYSGEPFAWCDGRGEQFFSSGGKIVLGDIDLLMEPA